MTNEEIIKHIETNCRNAHGEPMMDEQAFYEGAKWYREQQLKILNIPAVIKSVCSCGRREINVLSGICDICWNEEFPDEQTVL